MKTGKQTHAPRSRGWLKYGNPAGDPSTAPRCGAKTRAGTSCKGPCVRGRQRCRMHGGAHGIGGQPGNRNAWKHGEFSAEAKAQRREARAVLRQVRGQLEEFQSDLTTKHSDHVLRPARLG
jgi:hypothetical protein